MNQQEMHHYRAPADLLAGRVILVTGAGAGIGRTAALTYAGHGATVVLLDRAIPPLEDVYDAIADGGGPQPAIYPMDLLGATPDDYADLADNLAENFGRLDGLLSNAAILGDLTPVDLYPPETWAQVIHVNLNAPFLLIRSTLPLLRKAGDAAIVLTTADVGRRGRAYWGPYAAANAALDNLGQVLAHELENTRVRVNSLDPGPVLTAMRKRAYPAEDPGHLAVAADIMPTYLFLMGPDSIPLSGGRYCAQGS